MRRQRRPGHGAELIICRFLADIGEVQGEVDPSIAGGSHPWNLYRQVCGICLYIVTPILYRQISGICLYMSNDLNRSIQTLYADLLQQVETAPLAGTVYQRQRDGIAYHYAKVPVGAGRIDSFVGRVGDDAAEAQVKLLSQGMELAKARRKTVSILKSAGLAAPDRTPGAALDAIAHAGLFRDGAVLVGTMAYMVSEPLVGRKLPAPTLMTGDLDLATVNLAISADPPESMETILRRADPTFTAVMQLNPRQPAARFRNDQGYLVDLLSQARQREERPVPLPGLEAGAEPLQHLRWLIENPIPAVALWGAGVAVRVPQPARFAVHKLMVAQRRGHDRIKRQKDLNQAGAMIEALTVHDPFALEDAIEDARAQGSGWSKEIDRSLAELGVERRDGK